MNGFTTRALHGPGNQPGALGQRPASFPIFQTSTWRFDSSAEFAGVLNDELPGYAYGRGYGNPTVQAFEATVAALEGSEAAFAFSSGMAAIHAVCLTLASAGDRVLASRELYGGTYSLFTTILPRYGITVDEVDVHDVSAVRKALSGAALLYCETIGNPLCTVSDLGELGEACRSANVPAVVDNTFASPYLCNPVAFGFNFVVHSVTKMIAGHSDLIGGIVCCDHAGRRRIRETAIETGGAMSPFEAWLSMRGLQTLELRVERMCSNAEALVAVLESRPEVRVVHHPSLRSHPQHATAEKMFRHGLFGSMFSFELSSGADAGRWCEALHLAWMGASLGGTHTLVCHPASTTHRQVPPQVRRQRGLSDGLIRVSPGIENTPDLIADFEQAFDSL
jgi:cystathionine beta-lyase/cystathionine gamma-synthase